MSMDLDGSLLPQTSKTSYFFNNLDQKTMLKTCLGTQSAKLQNS